jgi:predicted nucleic acid-binding protein
MSLYIDTSVLLKLIFQEPESPRAGEIIAAATSITVSSLAHLEAVVQIQRRKAGGLLVAAKAVERQQKLDAMIASAPFHLRRCPANLIEAAGKQTASSSVYCPTLDRLHLAAMEVFGLRRLLTNDDAQAAAARGLGYEVVMPR